MLTSKTPIVDLHQIPNEFMDEVSNLLFRITEFKKDCNHSWEPVKSFDSGYSPRVDGLGKGEKIITHFFCPKCVSRKPIEGVPSTICRKCGGKMKHNGQEMCGQDRVHLHKCEDCGHEYDTT